MRDGEQTPFQGDDIAIATVTGDGSATLAALLGAIAGKRWTIAATDQEKWKATFGAKYPRIKNCQIEMSGTADWTLNKDGATFPIAAGVIKLLTCQNLGNIIPNGVVSVIIQF